ILCYVSRQLKRLRVCPRLGSRGSISCRKPHFTGHNRVVMIGAIPNKTRQHRASSPTSKSYLSDLDCCSHVSGVSMNRLVTEIAVNTTAYGPCGGREHLRSDGRRKRLPSDEGGL